jgi:ATP-binding protein involved in chromosome partitioning
MMPKSYKDLVGDGGSDIIGQVTEQIQRLQSRMRMIRATVAVVSGKGGVGKSAITVNLATAVAMTGAAVGVLDADLNGPSIAKMAGVRGETPTMTAEGVQPVLGPAGLRIMSMDFLLAHDDMPVMWEGPGQAESYLWRSSIEATALREFLSDTIWGSLDILFLDLPPGTDRIATLAGIWPALTGVIIVTIPSEVSYLVVRKSLALAKELKVPILGLVENMVGYYCQTCHTVGELFRAGQGVSLARDFQIPFLGEIPFDPRVARAADSGIPFAALHQDTPAGQILHGIAHRLLVGGGGKEGDASERGTI